MTLGIRDIMNDLGVSKMTVSRWIKLNKIKASMENRRDGWKIEQKEYVRFLDSNPRYRLIHEGEVYSRTEMNAKEDILIRLSAELIANKLIVSQEIRDNKYMEGYNRAITDIQKSINKEMSRKVRDSRSEQAS